MPKTRTRIHTHQPVRTRLVSAVHVNNFETLASCI